MDLGIIGALLILVGWAVLTLFFGAPAWSNALLTAGVFLLIWRIVVRGTPTASATETSKERSRPSSEPRRPR
ncbi:MAG: hypothetical protein ACYC2G_03345 [Gemmatimonadaceae bacterium]